MTQVSLSKEEMDIIKFKIIVDQLCEQLGEIDLNVGNHNPLTFIWGSKSGNPYTQAIISRSFADKRRRRPADYATAYTNLTGFIKKEREDIETAGRLYLKNVDSNARYHFIFWALMILVVEGEENRAENAAVIADAAYLLFFDREMLGDWILAVKVSLNEQSWQGIEFKTKEARSFFQR